MTRTVNRDGDRHVEPQNIPGNDDKAVEPIPSFGQIGAFAVYAHGHHFDEHLDGEEGKNEVVQHLKAR